MKITVFNGSPRAGKGNTHAMVQAFLEGANDAGASSETIFLAKKNIDHCDGCFLCWTSHPGECVIKDDMKILLEKLMASDVIVYATPVYVDNVTGILKTFMDRLVPLIDPHFNKDENNECLHRKRYAKYPKIVVIANCGYPEDSHFQVLRLLFRRNARNMHSEIIAEIYRGGGELLSQKNAMMKIAVGRYKKVLKKAGKELVENMKFSEETKKKLNKPLISDQQYIKSANKYWDKMLSKAGINRVPN
mgnify:CR=1 FL=1